MKTENIFTDRIAFDPEIERQRGRNATELKSPRTIKSLSLREKVQRFSERWGLEPETVYRKIQEDWLFSLHFAKDPGKQSIHQRIAGTFIQKIPLANNFRILPSGGNTSKWVCNGGVFSQQVLEENGVDKQARTIDFEWNAPLVIDGETLRFYASHKYTGAEGGSQNNQYEDLKNFVECIRKARSKNFFYLAIGDGPYYLREDAQIGIPRLSVLNEGRGEASRWQACTTNQVAWIIGREIKQWMAERRVRDEGIERILEGMPETMPAP